MGSTFIARRAGGAYTSHLDCQEDGLQPLNNVDITSCACGYGWPGRKLPPSIILRQALLDLLM